MIKLYGVPASRAFRSLWMLEELGLTYENVPTSFMGETRTAEFLKLNPAGKLPVLSATPSSFRMRRKSGTARGVVVASRRGISPS